MTRSEQSEAKPALQLKAVNDYSDQQDNDTKLTIFDGHGAKVAKGIGSLKVDLPRGIYTIRAERFGEIGEDTVILHASEEPKTIPAPRRHSAMPSKDTSHNYDFLQKAARHFSRDTTWKDSNASKDDPLLMIFVRATGDEDHSGSQVAKSLLLMNEEGEIITRFQSDQVQESQPQGWTVFAARQRPGNYILTDTREERAVSLPILVTRERWDTLVFVPFEGHPRLSAASIDMCHRNNGFDSDDPFTQKIDAAVQGLGMRLDLLPDSLRQEAIYGKFEHPFHGLIGAHAHFLGPQRNQKLEQKMLRNLWRLLEGSTDAIALLLLAQEQETGFVPKTIEDLNALAQEVFGETLDNRLPLVFPPMLRTGLNTLVRASLTLPDLIAPGSWLESAAISSYADGPWAVWDQETGSNTLDVSLQTRLQPQLSTQRLYPVIKRAIATQSTRNAETIHANDRLDDLLDKPWNRMPGILSSIARELPGIQFNPRQGSLKTLVRVKDLAHQLKTHASVLSLGQNDATSKRNMLFFKAETPIRRLTTQRLYPVIKRAIAKQSTHDFRTISANDRLKDLLDDQQTRMPGILHFIEEELPEIKLKKVSPSVQAAARVRDLANQLKLEALSHENKQTGLRPDTRIPDWLVNIVRERMESDGGNYDALAIARMANVPLTSVQRAADLVFPSMDTPESLE